MEVSLDTARFLLALLDMQTVSVGAPDFGTTVASILLAKQELLSGLESLPSKE